MLKNIASATPLIAGSLATFGFAAILVCMGLHGFLAAGAILSREG
jgi:hypothetical protein